MNKEFEAAWDNFVANSNVDFETSLLKLKVAYNHGYNAGQIAEATDSLNAREHGKMTAWESLVAQTKESAIRGELPRQMVFNEGMGNASIVEELERKGSMSQIKMDGALYWVDSKALYKRSEPDG